MTHRWNGLGIATLMLGVVTAATAADLPKVLTVGTKVLDRSSIEARWEALPSWQRSGFGKTEGDRRAAFLRDFLVPELLLLEGAQGSGVSSLGSRRELILRDALQAALRREEEQQRSPSSQEVTAFFEEHPELFLKPKALRLFRILVESEAKATSLLTELRPLGSLEEWRKVCRDQSQDFATAQRGGDLGFVRSDGTTDVPTLQVDAALYAAADKVPDGTIVPIPVKEGERFALLWRRGTREAKPADRTRESPRIREYLLERHTEATLTALLSRLRSERVKDLHPERLDGIDFSWLTQSAH